MGLATHSQRTPNKLAIKSGYEYFRINPGFAWEQVLEELALSIFVPQSLQSATIEIVMSLDNVAEFDHG